jgi:uncharacterized protein (TIGR02284 family)
METSNESVVQVLNRLLESCYTSQRSYQEAATGLNGSLLAKVCEDNAVQRGKFADELSDEVIKHLGSPVSKDSAIEHVKQLFSKLAHAFSSKDEQLILDSCQKVDESALDAYETALTESMPPLLKAMMMRHHEVIRRTISRLKVLHKPIAE